MLFNVIKRLVYTLFLLYTINIMISGHGRFIPINIYTIVFSYLFDILGIIVLIYLKYYY